jgi:hypothetical protein
MDGTQAQPPMPNGPPGPQQRGKMGGRGSQKARNSFSKDGAPAWSHQQHLNGSQAQHPQAVANGAHHRNVSGQIAAVHANGYAPAQPQPSLGEMASPDLERRKYALASECAKLQAVRKWIVHAFWTCLSHSQSPYTRQAMAGRFK